eukprot:192617-Prymnesium_polylepis.1
MAARSAGMICLNGSRSTVRDDSASFHTAAAASDCTRRSRDDAITCDSRSSRPTAINLWLRRRQASSQSSWHAT